MENKYYFLILEKDEIYCEGKDRDEAFNEIHPLYQKDRTPRDLVEVEFPQVKEVNGNTISIDKLVDGDFKGAENDVKVMRGIYIWDNYMKRFK